MSRQNDPIEREREEHPEPDETSEPIPVPDGEPVPVPIEEPVDNERAPIDEHSDRPMHIVSANELARLRESLQWGW